MAAEGMVLILVAVRLFAVGVVSSQLRCGSVALGVVVMAVVTWTTRTYVLRGVAVVVVQVASGQRLPLLQPELRLNGFALEARIYAERPAKCVHCCGVSTVASV